MRELTLELDVCSKWSQLSNLEGSILGDMIIRQRPGGSEVREVESGDNWVMVASSAVPRYHEDVSLLFSTTTSCVAST